MTELSRRTPERQRPGWGCVALSGLMTFGREGSRRLVVRHRVVDRGPREITGFLHPEPDNDVDPHAIAVHVEGERIAYLPGFVVLSSIPGTSGKPGHSAWTGVAIPPGGARPVALQLWASDQPRGIRVEGFVWLGTGVPAWKYTSQSPAPLTRQGKDEEGSRHRARILNESVAEGGRRAAAIRAGTVQGVYWLQAVEGVKMLKRAGRLEGALELAMIAIEGIDRSVAAGHLTYPPPWYAHQAAVILRKLGRPRSEELAVLEHHLRATPPASRLGTDVANRYLAITGHPFQD